MKLLLLLIGLTIAALALLGGCSDDTKSTAPTQPQVPTVTTAAVGSITETAAECGGSVTSDGGAAVTARGVCFCTGDIPTIDDDATTDGDGTGDFVSTLSGLQAGTTYHVRAYAVNSVGIGYGGVLQFSTDEIPATVTDIDGNVYATVVIGDQVWMAENLKVTHFRNGDTIPQHLGGMTWDYVTTPAFCNYDNSEDTAAIYGRLYNWYAVSDSRNIAPEGWHVPTYTEMQTLVWQYDYSVSGGVLKETGLSHWMSPNEGATNETGFTALPAGMCGYMGHYISMGQDAFFWSATPFQNNRAHGFELSSYSASYLWGKYDYYIGASVRCVRDAAP